VRASCSLPRLNLPPLVCGGVPVWTFSFGFGVAEGGCGGERVRLGRDLDLDLDLDDRLRPHSQHGLTSSRSRGYTPMED